MDLQNITLTTSRLKLVPISLAHAPTIFAEFTEAITRFMVPAPATAIAETEGFIRHSLAGMAAGTNLQLVILGGSPSGDRAEFLGCCGLHELDRPDPETGLWLKAAAHGRGYGRESIAALVAWAKASLPTASHIRYPVDRRNLASRKIPESLGGTIHQEYRDTGLGGQDLDQLEYWIPL